MFLLLIHNTLTLMYVDPNARQTYDYATPITCDNNPRNIIELDPDSDDQDFYIMMQIHLMTTHTIHYVLDFTINC